MTQLLLFDFLTRTVPSRAVMWACCEFAVPDLPGVPAAPATFSKRSVEKVLTARKPFSVNCGNAKCKPAKNTATTARMARITLRYVTVLHAMWIPGLLFDDTVAT